MSVTFRYSTKGRNGNFISKVCFGRSLQMDSLEYNGYLWQKDFLDYQVSDQIYNYDLDTCLDRVNQIVEKFPWMKDIFVLQSDDDETYYRFDLSKPADTVWFCLNLVRLILKGMESLLPVPTYNKMLDSMDGDLWNKIVFINSVHFDEERVGKGINRISTGKYCLNSFPYQTHTCLLSPFFVSKETIQAVLEDPIKVLNKLPSVIESKSGFLLKRKILRAYRPDDGKNAEIVVNPFTQAYTCRKEPFEGSFYINFYGIEAYWASIDVMNGTHLIDEIPYQIDSIVTTYEGFTSLKDWYLYCGLPEESFDKLFSNTIKVTNKGYERDDS